MGRLDREGSSGPPVTECTIGRAHSSQGCESTEPKQRFRDVLRLNLTYSGISVSPITRRSMVTCARRELVSSQTCPAGKRMRCRTGGGTEPPPPAVSPRQGRELSLRPTAPPGGQDHEILLPRKTTPYPKHVQVWEAETAQCTLRFPCASIFPSAASSIDGLVKA